METLIVGIGQPEMDKILEDGYFEYIIRVGEETKCLRLVLEDENGKMDKRGTENLEEE